MKGHGVDPFKYPRTQVVVAPSDRASGDATYPHELARLRGKVGMTMAAASTLLQANLNRVFNERDAARRRQAIEEIYAADAVLYEEDATYSGTDAIARAVTHLLGSLPRALVFVLVAPVMQNHEMGKLLWKGQLPDGTIVVTGTDVGQIEGGRIRTIHVFVDRPA